MYKTIIYLDGFEVKRLRLEQDYIDFKMREEFDTWQDFIADELGGYSWVTSRDVDKVCVTICCRPFVCGVYTRSELLMRFVDRHESFQDYLEGGRYGKFRLHHQWLQSAALYDRMEFACKSVARDLQNRGLKTVLKKANNNHLFTMVNQLLTEKIEQHEANK